MLIFYFKDMELVASCFFLIHDFGVDLSRGHVFVRKHLADSVDVRAIGYQ